MIEPPAPAGTIVLFEPPSVPEAAPRLFMVKRHSKSAFMANAYVFPGGRLDEADGEHALHQRLIVGDPEALSDRMAGVHDPSLALSLLACAVRETFEEACVLLAHPRTPSGVRPDAAVLELARQAVDQGTRTLAEVLVRHDLEVCGDALIYFDHWITPPFERRRFDTRFFMVRAPAADRARHDGHETTDSLWLTAAEALAQHRAGQLGLAPPTYWILERFAELTTLAAIEAWARTRVVRPCLPELTKTGRRLTVHLPKRAIMSELHWTGSHWAAGPPPPQQ